MNFMARPVHYLESKVRQTNELPKAHPFLRYLGTPHPKPILGYLPKTPIPKTYNAAGPRQRLIRYLVTCIFKKLTKSYRRHLEYLYGIP